MALNYLEIALSNAGDYKVAKIGGATIVETRDGNITPLYTAQPGEAYELEHTIKANLEVVQNME